MPPKKASGSSSAKSSGSHPPYKDMIKDAIIQLKDRGGSSRQAIKKHVRNNHQLGSTTDAAFDKHIASALNNGEKSGEFERPKGPSGPVKLARKDSAAKSSASKPKTEKKTTATKPAVKKSSTSTATKATTTKKPSTTKSSTAKPKTSTTKANTAKKTAPKKTAAVPAVEEKPTVLHKTKSGRLAKTTKPSTSSTKKPATKKTTTKKSTPKKAEAKAA